ncbi:MAG: SDR family oxidoreductase [Bacteroidetes Order II. Incertae sedis bacterium]|jgi:all-trans-retinol dehydrogenase (NAD+)|nr:SDR family oxidoreductase [Bacteroidetes Order II. bacterium]MBT4052977.1 SDR family oxidoreductase [Bacteroidetes Order II. bacterium]MBT4602681.1 SDR family oxidoreductase [Bacteroidetes Order II. bacterium]MBT5248857.1 SDR family oxidoreductase [Bacteroidetes Order II. bacterium]MBT6199193.1 SDR family oxidoreductase [Bacteroidetes Order II. bacterium]
MASEFKNTTILITGAASGLGRSLSLLFDAAGAHTIALDVDETGLALLQKASSSNLRTSPCDLTDTEQTEHVLKQLVEETGGIDILVNNAGVTSGKFLEELTGADVDRTFRINSISHFQTVRILLPHMMKKQSGHIVTIASAGGIVASPRMADYAASKFAAVGFDEAMRVEFRHRNIPIHTTLVAPFFINTGMFKGVKTRFSWLLPIMDQEKVAHRIFHAIRRRKKRLIMPWFVYSAYPLRLLPLTLFDALGSFFGIARTMDDYTGRTH